MILFYIILYYIPLYYIIIYICGLMCPTSRLFAAAVLAASEVVLRPQDIAISLCQAARTWKMRNFMWNVGRMGRIQDSFQRISQISILVCWHVFRNRLAQPHCGRRFYIVSTVGPISLSAKAPCRNAPRWHLQSPPSFTDMKLDTLW